MSRSEDMLMALRLAKGGWITRSGIHSVCNRYFLTNNAASELRAQGFTVEHKRRGRTDMYRLVDA